jgi:hypothetical protein
MARRGLRGKERHIHGMPPRVRRSRSAVELRARCLSSAGVWVLWHAFLLGSHDSLAGDNAWHRISLVFYPSWLHFQSQLQRADRQCC